MRVPLAKPGALSRARAHSTPFANYRDLAWGLVFADSWNRREQRPVSMSRELSRAMLIHS